MNKKVRHVLGISGGKDSAALAIYMHKNYPEIDIEYYTCDTGKELEATYKLIDNLENYLGRKIIRLKGAKESNIDPFDHHYNVFGNYLPSSNIRWCTKYLKLYPFEEFVGDDFVVSYVGIRGDEDREGYISKKPNIQSIFPFRKNIWSEDVITKILKNDNIAALEEAYRFLFPSTIGRIYEIIDQRITPKFSIQQKLNLVLGRGAREFNHVVFELLKVSNYPLSKEQSFALLEDESNLVRDDIFNLLIDNGVGIPDYYKKKKFMVDGREGEYARSRSGCYFCFFQQKIEWVWLYEQHPDKFEKAVEYENEQEGFTWNQNESLRELSNPRRIDAIKLEFLQRKKDITKSPYLIDILEDAEAEGCAACFI